MERSCPHGLTALQAEPDTRSRHGPRGERRGEPGSPDLGGDSSRCCLCGHGSAPEQFPPGLADLRSAGSGLQHPARGWLVLFPVASRCPPCSGLFSTAQLIAFAAVAAPLSYIAASANLPLCDAALDTMDRALGFDWKALLAWMNTAPILYRVLRPIYLSLTLQMTTVVLCLAFSGRHLWLRTYTLAFLCAALVCIAISAALPAAGAWPHYGLMASHSGMLPAVSTSWPVFYGLRDGSFRVLVAVGSEGIITFPSLHAALAVLVTAALWPVRYLRWAAVILNTAMLIATPIDGSHYFSDVLAGVALAALSLLIAQVVAARVRAHPRRRGGSSRRAHAASLHSPAGDQLARAPFVPSDARQRR